MNHWKKFPLSVSTYFVASGDAAEWGTPRMYLWSGYFLENYQKCRFIQSFFIFLEYTGLAMDLSVNETLYMRLKLQECGEYEALRICNDNDSFCGLSYQSGDHQKIYTMTHTDCSLVQVCENGACKVDAK